MRLGEDRLFDRSIDRSIDVITCARACRIRRIVARMARINAGVSERDAKTMTKEQKFGEDILFISSRLIDSIERESFSVSILPLRDTVLLLSLARPAIIFPNLARRNASAGEKKIILRAYNSCRTNAHQRTARAIARSIDGDYK